MRHELFEVGSYDYSDLDDRLDKPVIWSEEDLKLIAENYRGGIPLTEEHDRVYIGIGNNISYKEGKLFIEIPDELDMEASGMDVVITASQKALALPPGLSFVALSPRIIETRVNVLPVRCVYFDFKDYILNMKRGQTPFTPAVGIILQLVQRINDIYERGVASEIKHHENLAKAFRKMCEAAEIKVVEFPKSNALTTIEFPNENALEVFNIMKDKYKK